MKKLWAFALSMGNQNKALPENHDLTTLQIFEILDKLWKFSFLHRCEIPCEKRKEGHHQTPVKIALEEGGCFY